MSVGWLVSISYTAVNHEWMILAQLININQALKMTQGHKVKGQVQMCKFVKILFWLYITNMISLYGRFSKKVDFFSCEKCENKSCLKLVILVWVRVHAWNLNVAKNWSSTTNSFCPVMFFFLLCFQNVISVTLLLIIF